MPSDHIFMYIHMPNNVYVFMFCLGWSMGGGLPYPSPILVVIVLPWLCFILALIYIHMADDLYIYL